ncbi:MAG: hypothetical protein R3266_07220 [Gemmatimonadota bacterium]|nr:hypothetical protein [Gemmatimonadota bacterium]
MIRRGRAGAALLSSPNGESGATGRGDGFRAHGSPPGGGLDPDPGELDQTKVADARHAFFMRFDWYRR